MPRGLALALAGWVWFGGGGAAEVSPVVAGELPPATQRPVDYAKDIQPILAGSCYECHGGQKQKGSLRLDQKSAALKGGESGPVLVPGKSAESLLIQAVAGTKEELERMPKKKEPLTAEQIGLLRGWIEQGADWPEGADKKLKDWRKHWAFIPPARPAIPEVR